MNKIYRNGKHINDSIFKILSKNLGILYIPLIFAFAVDRAAYFRLGEGNIDESLILYYFYFPVGLLIYLYKTITRFKPLAVQNGDVLVININLFIKRKIDLSKVKKITCQFVTEHNQLMKVFYPSKAAEEIIIKQISCTTADLSAFIQKNHSVEVRYS
jgi:hypothetical protein